MAKNIEVTDEMYEFLMNLSKEIKEQDNRATATPYFFQVRETKEIAAHEGCGNEVWWSTDYEIELRTDEDKVEWIKEHLEHFDEYEDKELISEVEELDCWQLDDFLRYDDFQKFYVDTDYTYSNAFFTSKACDEHIRINRHNLKQPVNYLSHAYRNAEMDMMYKFLIGLTEK